MDYETWERLVRRYQGEAKANPAAYRRKLVAFSALSAVVVVGVLLFCLVGIGLLAYMWFSGGPVGWSIWIAIGLAALALGLARGLSVRIERPTGIPVGAQDAPALHGVIEEVRASLDAPHVDRVLVSDDLNASAGTTPTLGPLFRWRTDLILGLPYLQATSEKDFRSTIAHELGHFAGEHGKFDGRVFYMAAAQQRILSELEGKSGIGLALFRHFYQWYAPRFEALAAPLSVTCEFEADRASVQATDAETGARSLVDMEVCFAKGKKFWNLFWQENSQAPQPPSDVFSQYRIALDKPIDAAERVRIVEERLEASTSPFATHPALRDRLASLGVSPEVAAEWAKDRDPADLLPPSAASAWLGDLEPVLESEFSRRWAEQAGEYWQAQREGGAEQISQIDAARSEQATVEQLLDGAGAAIVQEDHAAATVFVERILQLDPKSSRGYLLRAHLKLRARDDTGLQDLETGMDMDPFFVPEATREAYAYLIDTGRPEQAKEYALRAERWNQENRGYYEERQGVGEKSDLVAQRADSKEVKQLRAALRPFKEIKAAYLVGKRLHYWPERAPVYLLFLELNIAWWHRSASGRWQRLLDSIQEQIPHNYFVACNTRQQRKVVKKLSAYENSLIYSQSRA